MPICTYRNHSEGSAGSFFRHTAPAKHVSHLEMELNSNAPHYVPPTYLAGSAIRRVPRVLVRDQLIIVAKKLDSWRCSVNVGSLYLVDVILQ